jgi:hypothetical protein
MSCERIEELLSSYLDGELSPTEKARVEAHLETCASCGALLAALREADKALAGIPELELSPALMSSLYAIPEKKRKFSFTFDFLLKPSLQPVFAAAAIFMTLFSFYLFNPNRKYIDRSISQKIHSGYNQVEKLYAKAGSVTDRLDSYKDSLLGSIKNWKIFGGNEEQPKK